MRADCGVQGIFGHWTAEKERRALGSGRVPSPQGLRKADVGYGCPSTSEVERGKCGFNPKP